MPPFVLSSASTRLTTMRSCSGRNFITILLSRELAWGNSPRAKKIAAASFAANTLKRHASCGTKVATARSQWHDRPVQSLEKPHGQRRLPSPARGVRADDREHSLSHARPPGHPADLHLAATRPASAFSRAEKVPRFLDARTRRPPPLRHRRPRPPDQAGGIPRDRRRISAELTRRAR